MTDGDPRASKAGQYALVMLIGVLALVVDQANKAGAIVVLSNPPRTVPVTSFFNLSLGFNRGVSFGFLSNLGSSGPTVLSLLMTAIVVFLIVWLWRSSRLLEQVGIALIIGGACGNLLDRIRNGAVTDFLDFYLGAYHWPTFNFADVSITLGAALVIVVGMIPLKHGNA